MIFQNIIIRMNHTSKIFKSPTYTVVFNATPENEYF